MLPKDLIKAGEIILEDADLLNREVPEETEEIKQVRREFESGVVQPVTPSVEQKRIQPQITPQPNVSNGNIGVNQNVIGQPTMNVNPNPQSNTSPSTPTTNSNPLPTGNPSNGSIPTPPKVSFRINPNKFG